MAQARVPASGQVVGSPGSVPASLAKTIRYVNKVGSDGWLQARPPGATAALVSLPKYTRA